MHYNDDKIFEYIDKELQGRELQAFEEHLQKCVDCSERVSELRGLDGAMKKYAPDKDLLDEEQEKVYSGIYDSCIDGKNAPFYKKPVKFSVPFIPFTGIAAAFVTVMIGSIIALNPRTNGITKIVPGANANLDRGNIYKVSNTREMSIEEHVQAIEDMGYSVVLELKSGPKKK